MIETTTSTMEKLFQNAVLENYQSMIQKLSKNKYFTCELFKQYGHTIAELYKDYPRHFIKMLKSRSSKGIKPYDDIMEWIYTSTSFLQDTQAFSYSVQTRLNWIFNGKDMTNNICQNPGCDVHCGLEVSLRLNDDFPAHCSTRCSTSDPACIQKSKATRLERYGDENFVNAEKAHETFAQYVKEDPEYWKKREAKNKSTKIAKGFPANWNNRAKNNATHFARKAADPDYVPSQVRKTKATKKKHFGDENFVNIEKARETRYSKNNGRWESKETSAQRVETFAKNHDGLKSLIGTPEVRAKCIATWQEKYHTDNPLEAIEIQEKCAETWRQKYGTDHPWKSATVRAKSTQTNLQKYGTLYGTSQKYMYHGIKFDSSWELAVWIYCIDAGIQIVKNPCTFTYIDHEKERQYCVDFEIDGQLVEIKGDHFFDKDGKMICPFRAEHWTDEEFQRNCDCYEAKHQCMIKNGVKILRSSDVQQYIDYVELTYGSDYLLSFQTK